MKIVVFENVLADIKDGFDLVNDYFFQNGLEFTYYASSQELGNVNNISSFDIAFIDIALSSNSDLDGIYLIKEILSKERIKKPEIIVVTGQIKIESLMKEHGIENIPVINKPFISEEVRQRIQEAIVNVEKKNDH